MSERELADSADLDMADVKALEEVMDREGLTEVCRSFFDLFGISLRVVSSSGALLADVHQQRAVCQYVNGLNEGRAACARTVADVKRLEVTGPARSARSESRTSTRPATANSERREALGARTEPSSNAGPVGTPELMGGELTHRCFTGAVYRILPIVYQGRHLGRFIVGPYLPADIKEVPKSLLTVAQDIDPEQARRALSEMPRVKADTALRIGAHLRQVVELLIFATHRARLTTDMHLASVRESYRQLAEKTDDLQQAFDRLKELDKLKSSFLATISHELRTPLTSIIGYSDMLGAGIGGELNEEQGEFVETIRKKGEELLALITSLLDLNKMEQGVLRLRREPTPVAQLLAEVQANIAPTAHKSGIQVTVECEVDEPVELDIVRMRQVLFNLADNAVKFTPENGAILLRAEHATLEDESTSGLGAVLMAAPIKAVAFVVRDTGIGIPEAEWGKIFDAFYQVDGSSTRLRGGAGLGLSIVRRIVDAHGGRVRVHSEEEKGTEFRVVVPCTPPPRIIGA